MKFWKRQATLQIGSKRFGMDDLYFKFTVPFEDSEKLGTATIEAYISIAWSGIYAMEKDYFLAYSCIYSGDSICICRADAFG